MRVAVVGGFGRDVRQIDSLAEHVAAYGCFRGCDAQALGEDASVVGAAGTVPQEATVTFQVSKRGFFKAFIFTVSLDAEYVLNLERC